MVPKNLQFSGDVRLLAQRPLAGNHCAILYPLFLLDKKNKKLKKKSYFVVPVRASTTKQDEGGVSASACSQSQADSS